MYLILFTSTRHAMKGGSKMLKKILALLLSVLPCLSQLNVSATWMPASLFPSEEINAGNRTCSIATFEPLEKSVIHGGWTIPTFEGSQILCLGMFGQQNLTEFLEVSPTSFLFPVALWIAEGLLLTVMLIQICVADVSDGRNHPLFVLGKCLT